MRPHVFVSALPFLLLVNSFSHGQEKVKSADDQKLLQGTWKAIALETNGRPSPESTYSSTIVTIEGDRVVLKEKGHPATTMNFKLNSSKSPREIDLSVPDGPRKGDVLPAIYELKGDDLKLVIRIGKGRPTEFRTRPGDDTEMFTLKRLGETAWKRFPAKGDGYSVELPGEPEARKRRDASLGVPVDLTIYVVRSERDRISYLASGLRLPGRLVNEREMLQTLEAARDRFMAELKGKQVSDEKVEFKQGVAREYLVKSTLGIDARVRIHVMADKLIMLQVVGAEDLARSKNVDRFLKSLQVE